MATMEDIYHYQDFTFAVDGIAHEDGSAIDVETGLSEVELIFAEHEPEQVDVLRFLLTVDGSRFQRENDDKSIKVFVFGSDYEFMPGNRYYAQYWLTETNGHRFPLEIVEFSVKKSAGVPT